MRLVMLALALASAQNNAEGLVQRMAAVNPNLQTYTASLHVAVAMHSMPFLSSALDGNYYFRKPDKQAVVFDTVPVIAQQFQKVYPKIDPPASWPQLYDISTLSQSASTTTLRLTPKHPGRVTHLDVDVDNETAMPAAFKWTYIDGGTISFDQAYERVSGNLLVKSQNGKVELPSYSADVTTTFSNFKVNVGVPDSVFGS